MKKFIRAFAAYYRINKQKGEIEISTGWMVGIIGMVCAVGIAFALITNMQPGLTLANALNIAQGEGYSFIAPDGSLTAADDLYTKNIYPQLDSSYSIGTNINRYAQGYFDQVFGTTISGTQATVTTVNTTNLNAPTGRAWYVIASTTSPTLMQSQADAVGNTQATVTAAINAGYKNIRYVQGSYTWASEPAWQSGVTFWGSGVDSSNITLSADFIPFNAYDLSSTDFGYFTVAAANGQTNPMWNVEAHAGTVSYNKMHDFRFSNAYTQTYVGLQLQDAVQNHGVSFNDAWNGRIESPRTAIYLNSSSAGAAGSWINGNNFKDIYSTLPVNLIEYGGTGRTAINGYDLNTFTRVNGQFDASGAFGVKNLKGYDQKFTDVNPWDISGAGIECQITNLAVNTKIYDGSLNLGMQDNGINTVNDIMLAPKASVLPSLGIDRADVAWLFKEGTGTTVADSSGHGRTGTLNGSPAWGNNSTHPFGFVTLTGTPKSISTGDVAMYGDKTIVIVADPSFAGTDGARHNFFYWKYDANNYIDIEKWSDNKLYIDYTTAGVNNSCSAAVSWVAGSRQVIVATLSQSGNATALYLNGTQIATGTGYGTMAAFVGNLYGGTVINNYYMTGQYCLMAIIPGIKSAQDIAYISYKMAN